MANALGYYFPPEQLDIAFSLLDVDHSGQIDLAEFKRFWAQDDRFARLQLDDAQVSFFS